MQRIHIALCEPSAFNRATHDLTWDGRTADSAM